MPQQIPPALLQQLLAAYPQLNIPQPSITPAGVFPPSGPPQPDVSSFQFPQESGVPETQFMPEMQFAQAFAPEQFGGGAAPIAPPPVEEPPQEVAGITPQEVIQELAGPPIEQAQPAAIMQDTYAKTINEIQGQLQGIEEARQIESEALETHLGEVEDFDLMAKYRDLNLGQIKRLEERANNGDTAAAAVLREKSQIDPGRLHKEQPWRAVLGGLAMAFAARATVLGGRDVLTPIQQSIERAIQRDIAAQEQDFERRGQAAVRQRSIYSMARQQFKDKESARQAALMGTYKQVALQAERMKMLTDDAQGQQRLDLMGQQMMQQHELAKDKLAEVRRSTNIDAALKRRGQDIQLLGATQRAASAATGEQPLQFKNVKVVDPAKANEFKKEAQKEITTLNTIKSYLPKVIQLRKEFTPFMDRIKAGTDFDKQEDISRLKSRMKALNSLISGPMRETLGIGARLEDREQELLNAMTGGDPTRVNFVIAEIQGILAEVDTLFESRLNTLGYSVIPQEETARSLGATPVTDLGVVGGPR